MVCAARQGYGPDWGVLGAKAGDKPIELKLAVDDLPITGRLVDLEGKPLAGVRVEPWLLRKPKKGEDLSAWVEAVKRGATHRPRINTWAVLIWLTKQVLPSKSPTGTAAFALPASAASA